MNQDYRDLSSDSTSKVNPTDESLTTEGAIVLPLSGKEISPKADRPSDIPDAAPEPPHPLASERASERASEHPNEHFSEREDDRWLDSMRDAIRSGDELLDLLGLPAETLAPTNAIADESGKTAAKAPDYGFPVFVPREFAARMRPGDPNDPLLRQVLPIPDEGVEVPGFGPDPVGDLQANVVPGVLHKYSGRALVITTGACGVHCRYCFRRTFPYPQTGSRSQAYAPSIDYLSKRDDIEEVILSGGDPLTLSDASLDDLIRRIESIPHVQRLRIHTRMPIVIPSRVNERLVDRLRCSRLNAWMVVHCNHAAEIDAATERSLARLVDNGIPVLNQSVLLRGVNDDVDTLEELSRALIACRVMPYYLHQLDRVSGASHFEVNAERGRELIDELETRLPGFAVPRFVTEIAGEQSKTRL
ncbi:EF-P beta-lysylation protein EpmB [Rhodopirellula sallentina]|uniref:L-lysine 2,3-aminomutase n=1 Tax=Rhodopirellula sallentina SM41 TaxID=1263870 RepID=M5UNJ9_9BACT|nr:EF-P beta-lysylation protein EpmB [Rhodopirellula sallentina]EMI57578.1 lysine 2,3-aminomutase YodO family protein [Rhodopirellula sallentina SM41]